MKNRVICLAASAAAMVFFAAGSVRAGDVTIKGVHLCCGSCVTAVDEALTGIDGVTKPAADRNSGIVTFKAADAKAAEAGIKSLADAGFYGEATHDDKKTAFPDAGAKKGAKSNSITFTGVHLCCGACVKGAQAAVEKIPNASSFDIDRNAKSITIRGSDIVVTDALAALNKAGFYGKIKKDE